jgi:hypothetical protein
MPRLQRSHSIDAVSLWPGGARDATGRCSWRGCAAFLAFQAALSFEGAAGRIQDLDRPGDHRRRWSAVAGQVAQGGLQAGGRGQAGN